MDFFKILLIALFFWLIVLPLYRIISTVRKARRSMREFARRMNNQQQQSGTRHAAAAPKKSKKIDPAVGEYVAFEEVAVSSKTDTHTTDSGNTTTQFVAEKQVVDVEWEDIK